MKIENILCIYDALVSGQKIVRNTFCAKFCVSERTFYRYMREISDFVRKHRAEYVVCVSERDGVYSLKKLKK